MFNLFQIYPKFKSKCIPKLFQIYVQLIPNVCQMYPKCMCDLFQNYAKCMSNLSQIYVQLIQNSFQTYVQLIPNLCSTYAKCIPNLFPTYAKFMLNVCQIHVQLIPNLCSTYAKFIPNLGPNFQSYSKSMYNLFQMYAKCIPNLGSNVCQIYFQLIPNWCHMYAKFMFNLSKISFRLMTNLLLLASNLFHNVDWRFLFAAVFFLQESCDYGSRLGWATALGIALMHQSCQSRSTLHLNHVCGVAVAVGLSAGVRQCVSSRGSSGSSGAARLISSRSGCLCGFWRNTTSLGCTMSSDKISWGFPAGLNHSEL